MNNDKSNIVSVDKDALASELKSINFTTDTESSTYAKETKTYSYIENIFQARDMVKQFWNDSVNQAISYSDTANNVAQPESYPDDSGFLDEDLQGE